MLVTAKKKVSLLLSTTLFACSVALVGTANSQEKKYDIDMTVWSVYGLGSGTYNDMAAVANVITNAYGTNIRLLPSDTGIGRLQRMTTGTADIGVLGEEYVYAFEGDLDFSHLRWGPQKLRFVWGPPSPLGMAVRENSGINSVEDLKGKTIAEIIANPSVNNKIEGYLAFGGLTTDDVKQTRLSYGEQVDAFKTRKIDAIFFNPYGSGVFELESSVDFKWIDLSNGTEEQNKRVAEVAPTVVIAPFTKGAGMKEGESVSALSYPTPLVAYENKSEDFIYQLVSMINEQYDSYKDITMTLKDFNIDKSLISPTAIPFHEGTIKFLKEKNLWTAEAESKNKKLLAKEAELEKNWSEFIKTNPGDAIKEKWQKWKKEHM